MLVETTALANAFQPECLELKVVVSNYRIPAGVTQQRSLASPHYRERRFQTVRLVGDAGGFVAACRSR